MSYFPADLFFMPALVALVVAVLTTRALRHGRRALAPGRPPLCGACGYDTRGLTTLTCPECGSDLRAVGIGGGATRRAPRLVSFAACAVFGAFVMYALHGVMTNTVMPMLPARLEYSSTIAVTSRADPARAFTIRSAGRGGATAPVTIEMQLGGGGGAGGGTRRFTLAYEPARDANFGPKSVLDWMNAANVTDAAAAKEAARVAGYARKVARYTHDRADVYASYGRAGGSRSSGGSTGLFSTLTESYSASPSRSFTVASQALRWLWAMLSLALLVVLVRAIVFPRRALPAFTPHADGE